MTKYNAEVHEEDDGSYWARVPELPGLHASGFSLLELREALIEAVSLYLDVPEGEIDAADPLLEDEHVSSVAVLVG
jgi:predicted RNase H-like HicB family nuclease